MDETQIVDLLTNSKSPAGFLLAVLIILAMVSGLFSKAAADYGGIFGMAARAIQRHKQEAIAADEASDARRLGRLEEAINRLEKEVGRLSSKDKIHHEYQLYVAGYWRKLQFWAVEEDVTLPPPPMKTYPEWKMGKYPDDD